MTKRSLILFLFAGFLIALTAVGCGSSGASTSNQRYIWPEPPDSPRVEYLKTFRGESDFAGGFGNMMNSITGSVGGTNFTRPYDISIGDNGVYYVTDAVMGAMKYDTKNKSIEILGEHSSVDLKDARGIAYAHGKIYIGLSSSKKVVVLDEKTGTVVRVIGNDGRFPNPVDIVCDTVRNRIYIVDIKLDQIFVCTENGDSLFTIGKPGSGDSDFNFPQSAALDSAGNLYVVDGFNFSVKVFDTEGKFLRKFGRQGDIYGAFARPKGIALDSFGNIYVLDAVHQHFQIFTNSGELLMFVGKFSSMNDGFQNPISIVIDNTNKIFVTDNLNGRIQVFQLLQGN